jgi:murein DD-endopeptidase MepM/ murein hydrolase activator NlpD
MSVGETRFYGPGPIEENSCDPCDHAESDSDRGGIGAEPIRSQGPSVRELIGRLQATKGSGPKFLSFLDMAGDVEKLAKRLSADGLISADDVEALVREAKDFQSISIGERSHLLDVLHGIYGPIEPDARAALAAFLGVADPGAVPEAPAPPPASSSATAPFTAHASAPQSPARPAAEVIASGPFKGFTKEELSTLFPIDMNKGRLTSHFGANDVPRAQGSHKGIDLANVVGTPIRFLEDGKITWASRENESLPKNKRGYGNSVWVEFPDGHVEIFAHLNKEAIDKLIGKDFKGGKLSRPVSVKKGQAIPGGIGNSGNTTGPHLHWEVRVGPSHAAVNPLWWVNEKKKAASAATPPNG